jgi:two-component system chemotaxis response regulator CheY
MKTNIGEMLKELRRQKGATQEELAAQLNVSGQSVSKWETGQANPDVTYIPFIAEFFGVSIDTLFNCREAMTNAEYSRQSGMISDDPASVVEMWESLHMKYPNDCRVEKELIAALCARGGLALFDKIFYHAARLMRANQDRNIEDEVLRSLRSFMEQAIQAANTAAVPGSVQNTAQVQDIPDKLNQQEIDWYIAGQRRRPQKPAGKNALIVDDAPIMLHMQKSLLEREGYNVIGTAGNGAEGVAKVSELKPDFVLMDIGMPEMNGIDATRSITESNPGVSVIIVSARRGRENVRLAAQAGAADFVAKPFQNSRLLEAIDRLYA